MTWLLRGDVDRFGRGRRVDRFGRGRRPPRYAPVRAALAGADDNYSCAGGFQQYLDGAKKPDTPEEAFFCSADRNGFLDGGIFDLVVDRTPAEAKTAQ